MLRELWRVGLMGVAIVVTLAGCGGGDDGNVVSERAIVTTTVADTTIPCPLPEDVTTVAGDDSTTTTASGVVESCVDFEDSTDSGDDLAGPLPDGCTLLSQASVAAAIAGAATPAQPQKPNEISSRCIWSEGQPHSLNLDVRAGTNAETTFNNTISGFTHVALRPADGWIMLGARESDRDYRLVIFEAYDGTYYIHLSLQGPDRDDGAATQVATALAEEVYANLG